MPDDFAGKIETTPVVIHAMGCGGGHLAVEIQPFDVVHDHTKERSVEQQRLISKSLYLLVNLCSRPDVLIKSTEYGKRAPTCVFFVCTN